MSGATATMGAVTVGSLSVDMEALLDQLNEVAEFEQFAADVYRATAELLPEQAMRVKAREFWTGAEEGRQAAIGLMRLIGGEPLAARETVASFLGQARGALSAGRSGRFGTLKNLQDMLVAAFLSAGAWTIVQGAAYGIGDPRLIQVAEREVGQKSLPVQWLLQTIAERSSWAVLKS